MLGQHNMLNSGYLYLNLCLYTGYGKIEDPFLISNFCCVLNVVCFLLGNSRVSEFYVPTFRNTLFHLHRRVGILRTWGHYPEESIQHRRSLSELTLSFSKLNLRYNFIIYTYNFYVLFSLQNTGTLLYFQALHPHLKQCLFFT